ncbi:MAG: sulfate/molybdate ABC transporter ATP-binding protein [Candidatus Dormibacteria bacterium]
MSLRANVNVDLGSLHISADVEVNEGEVVALLGPNGAGKTSLLRAVAGLLPIDSGRIALDERVLDDPSKGGWVPTERRPIGFVFQDYVLFPHLSVLANVAFGLDARGVAAKKANDTAMQLLESVGLEAYSAARPAALSGGQRQRVALARALAVDPRLLLLDEPLAALDATSRAEVRRDLRRHLSSFSGLRLLVTHDPLEATTLADRLVVIEEGRVIQTGSPEEVTARPRSRYVADLVGVNLLRGRADGAAITLASGVSISAASTAVGDVFAVIHPRSVALYRARPDGSPRNVWAGVAEVMEPVGDRVRLRVASEVPLVVEVTRAAASELALADGGKVWASIKATEVDVYPA